MEALAAVAQWAISVSCFPISYLISARDNERRQKEKLATELRRQEEWKENQPKPLPTVRPRALTAPLPEGTLQQTNYQSQSPFFKIPYEIRHEIYELVLGSEDGKALHIVEARQRLYHVRCCQGEEESEDVQRLGWQHDCWRTRFLGLSNEPNPNLLALPKTCRRMYVFLALSYIIRSSTRPNHLTSITITVPPSPPLSPPSLHHLPLPFPPPQLHHC
jgi:hypothetical protein